MRLTALALTTLVVLFPEGHAHGAPGYRVQIDELRETLGDPPAAIDPRNDPSARSAALTTRTGPYVSVQVNVDEAGLNILGDAANEPSLTVDPTNPDNKVIAWRQFDSITSDFRQAGWAFTTDGGQTWTFPGVLTPGTFRSDPVLGHDANGVLYLQSLKINGDVDVFRSTDGGASWPSFAPSYGGDKSWMAIDTSGGIGDGNVYGIWHRFFGCCGEDTFTRSTDGAQTFEPPVEVALRPSFGTLAVGPDGDVFAAGIDGTTKMDMSTIVVARSTNAENPAVIPATTGTVVPLDGSMLVSTGPNPAGLLGQINVVTDHSPGQAHGNVYVLASVEPDSTSANPMDVHFIRSEDGGTTWGPVSRVNDDPPGSGAWHWFGAISVAPNGRIDVIWNDTRNSSDPAVSELYYAYSYDRGDSWSPNVAVSPPFNTHVGWPNQNKIGDYYTIVSDLTGAGVAYSATFNGEQDTYYTYLFPDCNDNGVSDVVDTSQATSPDCNSNWIPDECETSGDCVVAGATPDGRFVPGAPLRLGRAANGRIILTWGASCMSDSDYGVYSGSLGDYNSHIARFCTTGNLQTLEFTPDAGDEYYLVVPSKPVAEGSYGVDSLGNQRSAGTLACRPQAIGPCGLADPRR